MKKKAIVTLATGKKYQTLFDKHCRDNWQTYCRAFNFDLIVLNDLIDKTDRAMKRSPAWQKLLILSQEWSAAYDQLVWVDADVIMNSSYAYDICRDVPIEKVGAVEAYSIPSGEIHDIALQRLYTLWTNNDVKYMDNLNPAAYYTNRGIPGDMLKEVMQSGVFVCSPRHHREIFEHIYYHYEDTHGAEWNYEMPAMSYELLRSDHIWWISPRFNYCVMNIMAAYYPELLLSGNSLKKRAYGKINKVLPMPWLYRKESACLRNIYELSIFMHFAGCADLMYMMR